MKRELVLTADGSKTLYIPEWNEHYHSSHGALQEAQHVFIKNGLYANTDDYITILEMGFGTGLNALLTYFAAEKRHQFIHYIGVEAYPVGEHEWQNMDYAPHANAPEAQELFEQFHTLSWNTSKSLSEHFVLDKRHVKLAQLVQPDQTIDLIFYDAFGPRVQPELWTADIFQLLYNWLVPGGILVTYCAKGQVKRDLKSVGFLVESLPGPPGKREMTRAKKPLL